MAHINVVVLYLNVLVLLITTSIGRCRSPTTEVADNDPTYCRIFSQRLATNRILKLLVVGRRKNVIRKKKSHIASSVYCLYIT